MDILNQSSPDVVTATSAATTEFAIKQQNIKGNAKVHVGNQVFIQRSSRASTFEKKRDEILEWISPLVSHQTHDRVRQTALIEDQSDQDKAQSPGKWLLESELFDNWRSRKIHKLWYYGMPGAGKTVLTSIIIDHLLDLRRSMKQDEHRPNIAFLYLSYNDPQTLEALVGSVIKQLVEETDPLPETVRELWKLWKSHHDHPPLGELSNLLLRLAEERDTYIVIDALDECPKNIRYRLFQALKTETEKISILVTSRYLEEFDTLFEDFKRDKIQANVYDLDLFLDYELCSQSTLKRFLTRDPTLKAEIKAVVRDRCDGMFLLASLHIKSLAATMTLADVRARLKELPKTAEHIYTETMDRIDAGDPEKKRLAHRTLAWIVLSGEPLDIEELQHALAVEPETIEFDPERIFEAEQIQDACQGLVEVVNDMVSLVHETAQSFFSSQRESYFAGFQAEIAQSCVAYLSLRILEQPDDFERKISYADDIYHEPDPRSVIEIQRDALTRTFLQRISYLNKLYKYPFVRYSARYLGYHLRKLSNDSTTSMIQSTLLTLLKERPKRNFLLRAMRDCSKSDSWYLFGLHRRQHGPRNSEDHYVFDGSLDSYDSYESGSDQMSDLGSLQELKSQPYPETQPVAIRFDNVSYPEPCEIPPQTQSQNSWGTSERKQSDDNDGATIQDTYSTAMHLAASLGWAPIVRKLADESSDESASEINALDEEKRSPLEIAVNEGFFDVATILIEHGASVSLETEQGHALLLHATQLDGQETVHRLITQAMDSLHTCDVLEEYKAANVSAWRCFVASLIIGGWLILANLLASFPFFYLGYLENVRTSEIESTLTEAKGKEKDTTRLRNHLQLLLSSKDGDFEGIQGLSQEGLVSFDKWDTPFHVTAFFLAVEFGRVAVVKDFLERGADVNMRDMSGNSTALHRAIARDYVEMVEVLLASSPDLNKLDENQHPPWDIALDHENMKIITMLRHAGADTNTTGPDGMSRLYCAAAGGHVAQVRFLLEKWREPIKHDKIRMGTSALGREQWSDGVCANLSCRRCRAQSCERSNQDAFGHGPADGPAAH